MAECSETRQANSGGRWTLSWSIAAGLLLILLSCAMRMLGFGLLRERPWEYLAIMTVSHCMVLAAVLVMVARGFRWWSGSWKRKMGFAACFSAYAALSIVDSNLKAGWLAGLAITFGIGSVIVAAIYFADPDLLRSARAARQSEGPSD